MKSYQFNYKVPIVVQCGLGPTAFNHDIKFLQIAAENMWQAIEKVKVIYKQFEDDFDLTSIIETP